MGKPKKTPSVRQKALKKTPKRKYTKKATTPQKKQHPALPVIRSFMYDWQNRLYALMSDNSNLSWRDGGHPSHTAVGWIIGNFTHLQLHKWTIKDEPNREGEAMVSFHIDAEINRHHAVLKVNVLCEISPYHPDEKKGTWGVNPVSATQIKWGAEIK